MVGFFPQLANSAPFFSSSRVSGVAEFTVNFLLQGRSWYTKWITVLEQQPVFAAFDTLQYLDQVWDSSKKNSRKKCYHNCRRLLCSPLIHVASFKLKN